MVTQIDPHDERFTLIQERLDHQSEIFKAEMTALQARMKLALKIQLEAAFKAHTEATHKVFATREESEALNGKVDVLAINLRAFEAESLRRFATKEDLAQAMYLLTWRMAAFGGLLLSAGFAFARYL